MKNEKDDKKNILESIEFLRKQVKYFNSIKFIRNDDENKYLLDTACVEIMIKDYEQMANWLEELDDRRNDYASPIEYYGEEGTTDNIKEYKKLCIELAKERKKNKGKESNIECLIIDKITELISKMKLVDVRKLKLFER